MPLYHRLAQVKIRLAGKVRFTEDPDGDQDKMGLNLARELMNEAEAQVELDLSPRFMAPFQTDAGAPFCELPLRPTQNYIRTMCELLSCVRILETDFGSGTAVNGEAYSKTLTERYKAMVDRLMEKVDKETRQWSHPPLPGLRLALFNKEADDGYIGMPIHVSTSDGIDDYPQRRINSPGQTIWNATEEELSRL